MNVLYKNILCIIIFLSFSFEARCNIMGEGIVLKNYGELYEFIIFINDEPLSAGKGLSFYHFNGYPLQGGMNNLKVEFFPLDTKESCNICFEILIMKENKPIKTESINFRLTDPKRDYHFNFLIKNISCEEKHDIIELKKVKKFSEEIKRTTISIVNTLITGDERKLGELFGLKNNSIKLYFPDIFNIMQIENAKVINALEYEQLQVVHGKTLALVKADSNHVKKKKKNELFLIRIVDKDMYLYKTCFVFGRSSTNLLVLGINGKLFPIHK